MLMKQISHLFLLLGFCKILAADKLDRLEVPGAFDTKVYTNVSIMGITDKGVKITHSDGLAILPIEVFPEDIRAKLTPPQTAAEMQSAPAQQPEAGNPAAPGETGSTVDIAKQTERVILVNGPDGGGSAFLIKENGRVYLYTAVHVMAGIAKAKFVTPSGAVMPIGDATIIEISDDDSAPDVCRVILPVNYESEFEWADEVRIGAPIIALGNSLAEKVVAKVEGSVAGVGQSEIEIKCDVVPGNSGGPIILKDTNKVVGLVTRASRRGDDVWVSGTVFGDVRRFAARPTKVSKWTTMSLLNLRAQNARLDRIRADTRALACVILLQFHRDGVTAPDSRQGDFSIRDVLRAGSSTTVGSAVNGAIAGLNRDLRLGASATLSEAAAKPIYARFFNAIYQAAKTDVAASTPSDYIRYHRPRFEEESELRKKITSDILSISGQIQGARFR